MKQINIMKLILFWLLLFSSFYANAQLLDSVVAVVEDDVVLERELEKEVSIIEQRIKNSKSQMPPLSDLRRQVLEKIILDKLQEQLAERAGVVVGEDMLNKAAEDIAQRNNMNNEQFIKELTSQGMSYKDFLNNLRNQILTTQVRNHEVGSRVKISDREVQHAMETQDKMGEELIQYHLGHILIALKEGASSSEIQQAQSRATELVKTLRKGADFTQTAMSASNDDNALKGGDLGWRTLNDMPTIFVDKVQTLHEGSVSEPIRSPSGYHILKMLGIKGLAEHSITKTKVRHILIKTNELIDDNEAKKRLVNLRNRILNGDDFAELARLYSDDKASALKGGSLDWVLQGDVVKPFEETMTKLKIDEISEPIQTQFGWHIMQVLGRENTDNSVDYKKNLVKEALRKRKMDEETELWLRRLRDEAFVEINPKAF